MKNWFVTGAILLAACISTTAQVKGVKHVIVIGMDGLGAYAFPKSDIPHIKSLMNEGAWSLEARRVLPSSSAVNWASMVMGAGPELHGFTEWGSQKPELPSRELDQYGLFPSIYTLLRQQQPKSEIGVIFNWGGYGYLFPKAAVNTWANPADTYLTIDSAITYLSTKKPDLLFIHLDEPDHVGHNIGHNTPAYFEQVHKNDSLVGKVIAAMKEADMWDNSIILLTADHGGIDKGHGGKTMQEMQIPWIIRGKGIRKNHEIGQSIVTYDTAATLAWIFGLKTPQVWVARPVTEAFEKR